MIKKNHISLILIFVAIIISFLFIQQLQIIRAQNEQIFDNKIFGLTVPYPFGWSLNEEKMLQDGTGAIVLSPPDSQSSISIGNIYAEFSPQSLAKGTIDEFRKATEGFELIHEGPLTINGRDAYDVFLTYKHPSKGTIQNEYIFIKVDNRLYSFSLQDVTSMGEYIKMATAMLQMANTADFIGLEKVDKLGTRQ